MDRGYLLGLVAGIKDEETRRIMQRYTEHVTESVSMGQPDHQRRATNFKMYFERSTTATSTSAFSFTHGLPYAPRLAIPVMDLNLAGSKLVPLEVAQAADSKRVYLKTTAGSTASVFALLVE